MFNSENCLKIFEERTKILSRKELLPAEMLKLIHYTFNEQYKIFQELPSDPALDLELTPVDRVMAGKPLLARENFPYDQKVCLELFYKILDHLQSLSGPLQEAADLIRGECAEDPELAAKSLKKFVGGADDYFRIFGEKTPQSPMTLHFLAQSAVTPSVVRNASQFFLALPRDHTWAMGHCPVCGSLPYISSLEGKQGLRMLQCSFCHTAYRFKRMACAFCQEEQSRSFEYFTARELPGFRVDICKSCRMYMKTIDFREMDKKLFPALDDLESLQLDMAAREQGYTRPTLSAWGF
ncbi:MAG: formate dehydrogenase accessory protein FdhE [Desulfonatronovibrionaceae bacterium]